MNETIYLLSQISIISLLSSSDSGKERLSGLGKEKGGEDKRKNIKSLIDKIPTSKEELFAYPIDASLVDSVSRTVNSNDLQL